MLFCENKLNGIWDQAFQGVFFDTTHHIPKIYIRGWLLYKSRIEYNGLESILRKLKFKKYHFWIFSRFIQTCRGINKGCEKKMTFFEF